MMLDMLLGKFVYALLYWISFFAKL